MEQQYAQALWQMVEGGITPHKAVASLKEVLERHGRLALLTRIGRAFARLAEKEGNKNTMVLTIAREKDERHARGRVKETLAEIGADDQPALAGLKTQVDDSIIGGWRLEGRGMLVDNSYKSTLLQIYHKVTK